MSGSFDWRHRSRCQLQRQKALGARRSRKDPPHPGDGCFLAPGHRAKILGDAIPYQIGIVASVGRQKQCVVEWCICRCQPSLMS
eukprot:469002-Rhodomonas_salina.2